jgi:hypothetical protein
MVHSLIQCLSTVQERRYVEYIIFMKRWLYVYIYARENEGLDSVVLLKVKLSL